MAALQSNIRTMTSVFLLDRALVLPASDIHTAPVVSVLLFSPSIMGLLPSGVQGQ